MTILSSLADSIGACDIVDKALGSRLVDQGFDSHCWSCVEQSGLLLIRYCLCYPVPITGGIIWEVEGRGSGSKGVAYHTDSPTQVEDFDLGW